MVLPSFTATLAYGSAEPIYCSHAAPSGTTNTISGNPTYSLFPRGSDTPVSGHSGQAVTGFDNTAVASPRVWKTLNASTPIARGWYRIEFTFTSTNSADSIARTVVIAGIVRVK